MVDVTVVVAVKQLEDVIDVPAIEEGAGVFCVCWCVCVCMCTCMCMCVCVCVCVSECV
jgi:hypothetical protein